MLEQMQNILENLRTAKRGRRNQQAQEMRQALDDLDALTREQQALRDDTFQGPAGPRAEASGKKGSAAAVEARRSESAARRCGR